MRWAFAALGGALFVATLAGGCRPASPPTRNLVLAGSRTMAPLMEEVGRRFEQKHPDVRVFVEPANVGRTLADTRSGLADLGMLGRPLRAGEAGLHGFPVARDGVAFIVHRDNPVKKLSPAQLTAVFTAAVTNWRDVGRPSQPVTVVRPADGMALREVFLEHFQLPLQQVATMPAGVGSCEHIVQAVAERPGAIAYVPLGCAETASARLPIRLLPLGGVPATLAQVRSGRYPFTRPLLLLTREPPAGLLRDFIDFAQSDQVRDLIEKHGFVPTSPGGGSDR
jgi:phosphate transport system substrate-binding protein